LILHIIHTIIWIWKLLQKFALPLFIQKFPSKYNKKFHVLLKCNQTTRLNLVVLKLWKVISSLKQTCLEHARAIFYSLERDLFKDVLHTLIKDHLAPTFSGFLVKSQIPNLVPNVCVNSCILGLNEQCEGVLGIYTSRPFEWCIGA
jgi:hypothetical protein